MRCLKKPWYVTRPYSCIFLRLRCLLVNVWVCTSGCVCTYSCAFMYECLRAYLRMSICFHESEIVCSLINMCVCVLSGLECMCLLIYITLLLAPNVEISYEYYCLLLHTRSFVNLHRLIYNLMYYIQYVIYDMTFDSMLNHKSCRELVFISSQSCLFLY